MTKTLVFKHNLMPLLVTLVFRDPQRLGAAAVRGPRETIER
jgi:hypothetical protein